jgi:hypothetical protein
LTADNLEETTIEPTYFNWSWNASMIFPAMEPHQFSQAMQSLQEYGLHIVDAADIAHHLKFANFNDPTPQSISDHFRNPLHYVTMAVVGIMICVILYIIYTRYTHSIQTKLHTVLPVLFAAPSAPPAEYVHNVELQNLEHHMPRVSIRH